MDRCGMLFREHCWHFCNHLCSTKDCSKKSVMIQQPQLAGATSAQNRHIIQESNKNHLLREQHSYNITMIITQYSCYVSTVTFFIKRFISSSLKLIKPRSQTEYLPKKIFKLLFLTLTRLLTLSRTISSQANSRRVGQMSGQ